MIVDGDKKSSGTAYLVLLFAASVVFVIWGYSCFDSLAHHPFVPGSEADQTFFFASDARWFAALAVRLLTGLCVYAASCVPVLALYVRARTRR